MSWPSIDHSILSPSGRVSKRAEVAAKKRAAVEIFGEGGLKRPKGSQSTEAENLLRTAKQLRELADRGMKPRAHRKEAERLEAKARELQTNPKRRRNPSGTERSQSLFQDFHGYPSSNVSDIEEVEHYRKHLTDLGGLEELEILFPNSKKVVPISFDHDTRLCASPDKRQLYFVGGNQVIDLEKLIDIGLLTEAGCNKDLVTVGPVHSVTYYAKKTHLQGPKNATPYMHEFGEEGGDLPILVYDKLNKTMSLSGGSYTIEDVGIKN